MYSIYTLLSIGLGILMKIYDNSVDTTIQLPNLLLILIKGLILTIFTVLSIGDFHFSFSAFIAFLGNYHVGGVDTFFWKLFMALALVLSMLSIHTASFTLVSIVFYVGFLLSVVLEPILIPEESSQRKTISRIITCVIVLGLYVIPIFNQVPFIRKLLLFIFSYFGTSIALTFMENQDGSKQ